MKRIFKNKVTVLVLIICLVGVYVVSNLGDSKCRLDEEIKQETLMDAVTRIPTVDSIAFEKVSYPHKGLTLTETEFYCQGMINHMYILQVDLKYNVTVRPSTPYNLPISGYVQNMLDQANTAEQAGEKVLFAINADVFGGYRDDLPGKSVPMGSVYIDYKPFQEFHHRNAQNLLYVLKNGKVKIGNYEEFQLDSKNVKHAVGAWHTLIWDGIKSDVPQDILGLGYHPRTFAGITKDAKTLMIFVVDGRQEDWSTGLQMQDMIEICAATGCYRAINFDGGGSTTLVARKPEGFVVLNKPSDEGNLPREVVDGLLIVEK